MQHNILVTGAKGQLGQEIQALVKPEIGQFFFTDVDSLDICNREAVYDFVAHNKITAILNCAAYTAVDKAESEPDLAFAVNALAVENLALAAAKFCCKLIHISTDYVYGGNKNTPYLESDKPNPLGVYAISKRQGEILLETHCPSATVIRTAWLYSKFGNNFVKTMLRLGKERPQLRVVFDQVGTPTNAQDLAALMLSILSHSLPVPGLYHYTNEGVCSWYDLAVAVMQHGQIACEVLPIRSSEYPTPTERPAYSVLDKAKIKNALGIKIPHWQESLAHTLSAIKEEESKS